MVSKQSENKTYISEYTFSSCDPPEFAAAAAFSVLSDDFFFQGQLRRSISDWKFQK
jgi:indole-3-glycerol phosphate synthase